MGKKKQRSGGGGGRYRGRNNSGNRGSNRYGGGRGGNRRRNSYQDNRQEPDFSDNGDPLPLVPGSGVLEMHPNGYGFLRDPANEFLRESGTDPFVPGTMIEKFGLREGLLTPRNGAAIIVSNKGLAIARTSRCRWHGS